MSSKRRLRRRGCENKRPYPTKEEAVAAARAMNRHRAGMGQKAYACEFAPHWHIGRPTKEKKKAIATSKQMRRARG